MIYILSFGKVESRILGVFTSQEQAYEARERVIQSQVHPPALLFIHEFEPNQLTIEADMLV
ncbi:MAG TPA: hypothetical protein VH351_04410 [Bryobacteraceae bacterium]|jgi:hypothetical protein|nr:hypothetical protein [Bryobacteraceae bacterium]